LSEWPDGPYEWQVKATANILDGHNQLIIAGYGNGKTAVTYLHLLFVQELFNNPDIPCSGCKLVQHGIALIISPLADLAHSQVKEMLTMGIHAVSLDKQSIKAAQVKGRNLLREVAQYKHPVVIISPERLYSPEFDRILQTDKIQEQLALCCIDEVHVVLPWSCTFCEAYAQLGHIRA
ncbi:hypothetical protein HETIRDRAFT_309794, partial [Heterobasidion irregulare TC 32-1]